MGLNVGDILSLCTRSQEQDAKPSSFVAGPFLVLNRSFACKFVGSLAGELQGEPEASTCARTGSRAAGRGPWRASALTSFPVVRLEYRLPASALQ